ncbi:hypothetical protein IFM58399_05215 [Aspergillus lentulus]|uniref:uncharacterized protein n=1 Tax=Aspergillus lentulus TaxID=293939 RepID=UPI001392A3F2|nr:uncharacterized protein IFM58399_05215 [Aspergillus lentulus]GFF38388.1 hypothetical protein IFM58399_05215 [Aspergillus lentulus]GFG07383.1 hypothetical protein IFM61392_04826 [Aspergillus lentulus]
MPLSCEQLVEQACLRDAEFPPTPWRWSDGPGFSILPQVPNRVDLDEMARFWKVVDAVWDYDVWGYPPSWTRLSDAVVFKLLLKKISKIRFENWPFDFNSRGQMRFERAPLGPAVSIERKGRYYYPEIGGRYGAIIISSRGVTSLTFDDEDRVSWDGMAGTPVIWAKEVSLDCPATLTRPTVVTETETEDGQDVIMVSYGPDEEPEDAQGTTDIVHVKKEEVKREDVKKQVVKKERTIKSEVANGSQRHRLPRTLKRKPETQINSRSKRGKATSSTLKRENIPIKSEAVNRISQLDLKNEPDTKPPTSTPQQQSSAHSRARCRLKREAESRIVTGRNTRSRARSSASTQSSKTESWVEMASTMIRQAASANREHQARIGSIREDIKSLQARMDALNASAPLPRALEDVRKLIAEHKDDVRGTEKIERTMNIILQKLPS